ncbi:ferritin-like domain-containing protein [Methylococcus capsulatus]|uniref:ferritin-like domain-containing protein n=1 Tax=Methylococcus capsulatus TaxID=414 RepID=UPI001C531293|nr:ferritin-like domain-containing protein [Methylococcus capsulatus]QXP88084.1 ferritin-like domain-containing protein [Methylococcus capsulatus]QXP90563.1 ferritin-like domain-containing protein [Methylococcus capsulatus]QXP94903.1 ferritin-like domain-containing protein [Methylococcus capsulatus]UQN13112.1 ferritin-like domain-containing protein [Methylococcus capsulatus]
MLSTRSVFQEIRRDPRAFQLLLSIAAKGETQGGWENERIAALTPDPVLARKVRRHGADETKHGLMFAKLLRKAGLDAVPVPADADYCMLLERRGIGLPHGRLGRDEPLGLEEILQYLVHSKVTEERAFDEVNRLLRVFGGDAELAPSLRVIAEDETNHLAYAHEELLRLSGQGHGDRIARMLKSYALAEIRVYRDVGLAFVRHMAALLGWSGPKQWLLKLGVSAAYILERTLVWRRLAALRPPLRSNAMGS